MRQSLGNAISLGKRWSTDDQASFFHRLPGFYALLPRCCSCRSVSLLVNRSRCSRPLRIGTSLPMGQGTRYITRSNQPRYESGPTTWGNHSPIKCRCGRRSDSSRVASCWTTNGNLDQSNNLSKFGEAFGGILGTGIPCAILLTTTAFQIPMTSRTVARQC
jgi:hypothetical protein